MKNLNEEEKRIKLEKAKKYREDNKEKIKEANRLYREQNKEKIKKAHKKYREDNVNKIKESNKKYREQNKENIILKQKEYRKNNKEKIQNYYQNIIKPNKEKQLNKQRIYRKNNKDKVNMNRRVYENKRKNNDSLYNLKTSISSTILKIFKRNGYKKNSKTQEILGCSFSEFKLYLEGQFEPWMNWDNRGLYNGTLNYGWDIDHIIPISSANTEEDIIKLNHYTNLQPLCSKINRDIKKNNL